MSNLHTHRYSIVDSFKVLDLAFVSSNKGANGDSYYLTDMDT